MRALRPSFDSLVLAAVARDLGPLVGARVVRITQPERAAVGLDVRGAGRSATLYCSIDARWARIHLSAPQPQQTVTPFLQLLRARLDGARVAAVRQVPFERVLALALHTDAGPVELVAELMGRHSNLILVAGGTIAGSLKVVTERQSSIRPVLPGRRYVPPPADRPTPAEVTAEALAAGLQTARPLAELPASSVRGLSPFIAAELAVRAGLDPHRPAADAHEAALRLWPALRELVEIVSSGAFAPHLYLDGDKPVAYAPFPLVHLGALQAVAVATMSEAVAAVVSPQAAASALEDRRASLLAAIDAHLGRLARAETAVRQALQDAGAAAQLRLRGELLLTHAWQIPPGAAEVTLPGPQGPVTIPLRPELSAVDNARRYFRRYARLRAGRGALTERLARLQQEQAYLDQARALAVSALAPADLADLGRELAEDGYLRAAPAPGRPQRAGPRTFRLSTGHTVLVGRTNRENDALTFKTAAPDDLWFHARGVPGAHVILRTGGRKVGAEAIVQAAAIAAYFSRARGAGGVDVDYTLRRYVRKPRGARPGMVTYERERTVRVTPRLPR